MGVGERINKQRVNFHTEREMQDAESIVVFFA